MFRAVEIDGEPYWDGGFSGNPTLTPLVLESDVATPSSCRSTRSSGRSRRAAPERSPAG
jgi:predicted acylesterase/phospholipase RssA